MPRPVEFLDDAMVEARAAYLWYRKRSEVAAPRFGTRCRSESDRKLIHESGRPHGSAVTVFELQREPDEHDLLLADEAFEIHETLDSRNVA